jgi:hypothetical protein
VQKCKTAHIALLLPPIGRSLLLGQIRGFLTPSKPLGDILGGMRRTGVVTTQGEGRAVRYFYFAAQG